MPATSAQVEMVFSEAGKVHCKKTGADCYLKALKTLMVTCLVYYPIGLGVPNHWTGLWWIGLRNGLQHFGIQTAPFRCIQGSFFCFHSIRPQEETWMQANARIN